MSKQHSLSRTCGAGRGRQQKTPGRLGILLPCVGLCDFACARALFCSLVGECEGKSAPARISRTSLKVHGRWQVRKLRNVHNAHVLGIFGEDEIQQPQAKKSKR